MAALVAEQAFDPALTQQTFRCMASKEYKVFLVARDTELKFVTSCRQSTGRVGVWCKAVWHGSHPQQRLLTKWAAVDQVAGPTPREHNRRSEDSTAARSWMWGTHMLRVRQVRQLGEFPTLKFAPSPGLRHYYESMYLALYRRDIVAITTTVHRGLGPS